MNIALLGYGRMGRTIEKTAEDRGHKIGLKVDKNGSFSLKNIDVAIDFSVPEAAVGNISQSLEIRFPWSVALRVGCNIMIKWRSCARRITALFYTLQILAWASISFLNLTANWQK